MTHTWQPRAAPLAAERVDGVTRPQAASRSDRLLDDVRAATADWHRDIERRVAPAGSFGAASDYVRFLRATLAVMAPLERDIAARLDGRFDLTTGLDDGPRRREDRIRHDLRRLGSTGHVAPVRVPDLGDTARAFGAAYVLQGSLLGGAILARSLHEHLSIPPDGTTYLRMYGAGLGAAWRRFIASLDTFAASATPQERAAVIETAIDTFQAMDDAFVAEGLPR